MENLMNVSALSMDEAEMMVKVIEKWLRHFYNVYGVRRETSFSRRANDNIRAQIRVWIDSEMWAKVRGGVMSEMTHRLEKSIFHCSEVIGSMRVYEFCTLESSIE